MSIRITNGARVRVKNTSRGRSGRTVTLTTKRGDQVKVDRARFALNDITLPGEYNPHKVRVWVHYNQFGVMGAVWASNLQDALDELVDQDLAGGILMDEKTAEELEAEGEDVDRAGNASEPVDLTYYDAVEVMLDPKRDAALIEELKQAQDEGAAFLSDLDEGPKANRRARNPRTPPDEYGDRTGYHVSLSFGQLPSKAEFRRIWADEIGAGCYNWDLKGLDREFMRGAVQEHNLKGVTAAGVCDADAMYTFLKALEKRDDYFDDDGPAQLASAIVDTLGIEWV